MKYTDPGEHPRWIAEDIRNGVPNSVGTLGNLLVQLAQKDPDKAKTYSDRVLTQLPADKRAEIEKMGQAKAETDKPKTEPQGYDQTDSSSVIETIGDALPTEGKLGIVKAGGRLMGKDVAADMLDHYQNGGGQDKQLDSEWLRSQPEIQTGERENRDALNSKLISDPRYAGPLSKLKEGESVTLTVEHNNDQIEAKGDSDLHYASHLSNLTTSGVFTATRKGGKIVIDGEKTNSWRDPYD